MNRFKICIQSLIFMLTGILSIETVDYHSSLKFLNVASATQASIDSNIQTAFLGAVVHTNSKLPHTSNDFREEKNKGESLIGELPSKFNRNIEQPEIIKTNLIKDDIPGFGEPLQDHRKLGLLTEPIQFDNYKINYDSRLKSSSVSKVITPDSIISPDSIITPEPEVSDETLSSNALQDRWINIEIKKGDTLSGIFDKLDIPTISAIEVASADKSKLLRNLRIGKQIKIKLTEDNDFSAITYKINTLKTLTIEDIEDEYVAQVHIATPVIRIKEATGIIQTNMYHSARNSNVSDELIQKLSGIFKWDIDFSRDLQNGDRFSIIYEQQYIDKKPVNSGEIIAAEFIISNKVYRAIRHISNDGDMNYFTPDGDSLKKAFIRNPLKHVRITSRYGNRFHPIKRRWKQHKGVDYAARSGTKIMSTADGKIIHVGRKGAYGKTIIIDHGQGYSTLYAHLRGYSRKIRRGTKVKQGQIIGYVGKTGLATGPHLHYEFRVHNRTVDPLKVKLPNSLPINSNELQNFIVQADIWVRRLNEIKGQSVASIDTPSDSG